MRTLVVDDSIISQRIIHYVLESYKDIEIVGVAKDGGEALDKFEALRPSLVLLDMLLPDTNGLLLLMRLGSQLPDTRIIAMSIWDFPDVRTACLENGAHGFVPKSRLREELPAEIRRILSSLPSNGAEETSLQGSFKY